MKIAVASGKGGTGKTTVAVNLALSLKNAQLLDCDVEEPNAHLFLKPEIRERHSAKVLVPKVKPELCTWCGECQKLCAFKALVVLPASKEKNGEVMLFPNLCHSCGACIQLCPQGALQEIPREIGSIEIGQSEGVDFVHGKLFIGEAVSPPLIKQVKALADPSKIAILDAPPGTSCPVIATVKDCDFCILVTEPTPFGLNDLSLAVEVIRKMNIPFGVVMNRAEKTPGQVEAWCSAQKIPLLLSIPFEREIAQWYSKGIPLVRARPDAVFSFQRMMEKIKEMTA